MTSLKEEAVAGPCAHSQEALELGLKFRCSDHKQLSYLAKSCVPTFLPSVILW